MEVPKCPKCNKPLNEVLMIFEQTARYSYLYEFNEGRYELVYMKHLEDLDFKLLRCVCPYCGADVPSVEDLVE